MAFSFNVAKLPFGQEAALVLTADSMLDKHKGEKTAELCQYKAGQSFEIPAS